MNSRRVALPLYLGVLVLGLAAPALGTVVKHLDFKGLEEHADIVILGTVVGAQSEWTVDGNTIVTLTRIWVERGLKGHAGATDITVQVLGGTVGSYTVRVPGAPSFQPGERVLLFLERRADGSYGVVSLAQGSFKVERDPATGLEMVRRDPKARYLPIPDQDVRRGRHSEEVLLEDVEQKLRFGVRGEDAPVVNLR